MNVEYNSKAEKYDIYTVLGCEYKDSREKIKQNAKNLLKMCHPDKTDYNEGTSNSNSNDAEEQYEDKLKFHSEFFSLVNYSFKTLCNPILREIYNQEGHRGLKIFHNYREEVFDKIMAKYPSKALENEDDENYIEAIEKIMKKLRKIKFDLIQTNFEKYTNERQKLEMEVDVTEYLKSGGRVDDYFEEDEMESNNNDSTRESDFLSLISNSTEKRGRINTTKTNSNKNSIGKSSKPELILMNSIKLNHSSFFIHSIPNTNSNNTFAFFPVQHKFSVQMEYNTEDKYFQLYPRYGLLYSLFNHKSKFRFDTLRKRIDNKLYFTKIDKLPFLQQPYIKTSYKYSNPSPPNITIGNKYKDEVCKVKSYYTLPKNQIKIFFMTYIKDIYNSVIGFNVKNLHKLILFYRGQITPDLEAMAKCKLVMGKSTELLTLFLYKISKRFKLQISNQFNITSGSKVLNIIGVGLKFKSFNFQIPLILSKIENTSSLKGIIMANVLINGVATAFYYVKKLIF